MKIYTRVVINIEDGRPVAAESFDYDGPVAELKGPSAPKAQYSASGKIVNNLYGGGSGPLGSSLKNILANPGDDPFTQRQLDVLTQRTRGGYGARGLAGSGIGIQGEQDVQRDFLLNRGEQKQNQAIQILGTGSSSPTQGQAQQPRGFLGLK
jgi:hypothetical protein